MDKRIPYLVVFLSGYVILGFETIGTKLFAPFIGTTVPVWAALMAVIIAASSVGYYLGGIIGKKNTLPVVAGMAFVSAAVFVFLSAFWRGSLLEQLAGISSYGGAALLASICVFFVPTLLLSLATVVITRIAVQDGEGVGRTAGRLYACATLGSVCGVFSIAYALVPLFPLSSIMNGLAVAMLCGGGFAFLLLWTTPAERAAQEN